MKSIVVHAGLPKTGTSAVQAWLHHNTEQLAEVGDVMKRGPERSISEPALPALMPFLSR